MSKNNNNQKQQVSQPVGFSIEQVNLITNIIQKTVGSLLDAQTKQAKAEAKQTAQTVTAVEQPSQPIPTPMPVVETATEVKSVPIAESKAELPYLLLKETTIEITPEIIQRAISLAKLLYGEPNPSPEQVKSMVDFVVTKEKAQAAQAQAAMPYYVCIVVSDKGLSYTARQGSDKKDGEYGPFKSLKEAIEALKNMAADFVNSLIKERSKL